MFSTSMKKTRQFTQPPCSQTHKPHMTYDETAFPPLAMAQSTKNTPQTPNSMTLMNTTTTATTPMAPYDYHAKLRHITNKIKTNLKSKFEMALAQLDAKLAQKLDQMENKFDHQFQQLAPLSTSYTELKATRADHTRNLTELTKNKNYLITQVNHILKYLLQ